MSRAKPPFGGPEWVADGDAFVRVGTGDRWFYNPAQDQWRWRCGDAQWGAVLAAAPKILSPDVDLKAAVRADYNEAASDYRALVFYHRARFAKGPPAKKWRRNRKLIETVLAGIEADSNLSFQNHLRAALRFTEAAIIACEMQGAAHHGKKPERDWLYVRLLSIWTRLGGKLSTGRPSDGKSDRSANGPTIRFLLAALTPILRDDDKIIGAEAAKKIVEAEIERRERLPGLTARWVKFLNSLKKG
jgi:hypothetical protein